MSQHIVPVHDLIEHETSDACVCGPTSNPVRRADGSYGWVVVHNSLDGREHREPDWPEPDGG
jgi:hypothetical protein